MAGVIRVIVFTAAPRLISPDILTSGVSDLDTREVVDRKDLEQTLHRRVQRGAWLLHNASRAHHAKAIGNIPPPQRRRRGLQYRISTSRCVRSLSSAQTHTKLVVFMQGSPYVTTNSTVESGTVLGKVSYAISSLREAKNLSARQPHPLHPEGGDSAYEIEREGGENVAKGGKREGLASPIGLQAGHFHHQPEPSPKGLLGTPYSGYHPTASPEQKPVC